MSLCSSFLCQGREGRFVCSKCKDANPPTTYCSQECQKDDWKFHKKYCGKQAYVFSVELMGSSNPIITRTVLVPSWFTFQEFHYTLQYIFGPWQNCHLHDFKFVQEATLSGGPSSFEPQRRSLLHICVPEDVDSGENSQDEREVNLSDIYDASGVFRSKVTLNGGVVAPLIYEYDFGDCWEHLITFRGSKLARAARPLVKEAVGCGPVEDCGGIQGWNEVKRAFWAENPTTSQTELIAWAKERSGLADRYDPVAPIDIVPINYEGRWENHYKGYGGRGG